MPDQESMTLGENWFHLLFRYKSSHKAEENEVPLPQSCKNVQRATQLGWQQSKDIQSLAHERLQVLKTECLPTKHVHHKVFLYLRTKLWHSSLPGIDRESFSTSSGVCVNQDCSSILIFYISPLHLQFVHLQEKKGVRVMRLILQRKSNCWSNWPRSDNRFFFLQLVIRSVSSFDHSCVLARSF